MNIHYKYIHLKRSNNEIYRIRITKNGIKFQSTGTKMKIKIRYSYFSCYR